MIRALTVQTGVQDQQPAARTGLATNGLAKTETCLIIDVIHQHARRRRRLPQLYCSLQIIPDYLYLADVFIFMSS